MLVLAMRRKVGKIMTFIREESPPRCPRIQAAANQTGQVPLHSNYPPPTLICQAETAARMVWKGFAPANRAVSTVVRRLAWASAAHLAR